MVVHRQRARKGSRERERRDSSEHASGRRRERPNDAKQRIIGLTGVSGARNVGKVRGQAGRGNGARPTVHRRMDLPRRIGSYGERLSRRTRPGRVDERKRVLRFEIPRATDSSNGRSSKLESLGWENGLHARPSTYDDTPVRVVPPSKVRASDYREARVVKSSTKKTVTRFGVFQVPGDSSSDRFFFPPLGREKSGTRDSARSSNTDSRSLDRAMRSRGPRTVSDTAVSEAGE